MIRLAEVADAFLPDLEAQYGNRLLPGQRNAFAANLRCRTEECGTAAIHCHDCQREDSFPLSCPTLTRLRSARLGSAAATVSARIVA